MDWTFERREIALLSLTLGAASIDAVVLMERMHGTGGTGNLLLRMWSPVLIEQADSPASLWSQSVYGQTLLCPSVFRLYNDAVLRAAFLRAAYRTELDYSSDSETSQEISDVILADLQAWQHGKGDSLPEFALALATARLRLVDHHAAKLVEAARASELPEYIKLMFVPRALP